MRSKAASGFFTCLGMTNMLDQVMTAALVPLGPLGYGISQYSNPSGA